MHKRIAEAERIVDHVFADKNLIASALTHPSAVEGRPVSASYERLEFLGDSILGAMVATDLFERFPSMDEGQLTQLKISLVSGQMLSPVAEQLGLAPLILMGESERGTGARGMHSALENVYESIVGALYLDAGFDVTHDFVLRTLEPHMSPGARPQAHKPQVPHPGGRPARHALRPGVQAPGRGGSGARPHLHLRGHGGGTPRGQGPGFLQEVL